MKKVWDIICSYSSIIKIVGRLIIFICLILLLVNVFGGTRAIEPISWAFIITGVVIYCIGWIANIFERRKKSRISDSEDNDTL
jgi:predicted PurR-regulated permease PerM